jgi:hypothetical protein
MPLCLSEKDHWLVAELRRLGVLEEIDAHRLSDHTGNGTALVMCADGDHFSDIWHTHCKHTGCERHHTVSAAGGAIVGTMSIVENLDLELFIAREVKKINSVALTAHVPCAAATRAQYDLMQILRVLHDKKVRIKHNSFVVHSFVHVAYKNGRKRTYFVNWPKWREYLDTI